MSIETAYHYLYLGTLIWLALLIAALLVRSIIGPGTTDRILCINMIGTLVVACIAILSRFLEEDYLTDVGLLYTMISFVSVMILAATYIPSRKRRDMDVKGEDKEELEALHRGEAEK